MSRIKIISILIFLFGTLIAKSEGNIMFEKANQLYHNKLYDSASNLYQQMINDGYAHAELFYNAGNAYYRTNQIGRAIWCYRKSQLLNDSKYVQDNLALANKRIKQPILASSPIFFIRWWRAIYSLFSINGWAIFSLSCFFIALGMLFLKKIKSSIRISSLITNLFLGLTLIGLFFTSVRMYQHQYQYRGILIGEGISFTSNTKSESIELNEGIEVIYKGKQKQGILIELPDGRKGVINPSLMLKLD